MKTVAKTLGLIEWAITLGVSYFLLQFGTDCMSRWVASSYVYDPAATTDTWLAILGCTALIATFLLIHTPTRWYTAVVLTTVLVIASLTSLTVGESQPQAVSILGLGSALVVVFSHRPNRHELDEELPSYVEVENHV